MKELQSSKSLICFVRERALITQPHRALFFPSRNCSNDQGWHLEFITCIYTICALWTCLIQAFSPISWKLFLMECQALHHRERCLRSCKSWKETTAREPLCGFSLRLTMAVELYGSLHFTVSGVNKNGIGDLAKPCGGGQRTRDWPSSSCLVTRSRWGCSPWHSPLDDLTLMRGWVKESCQGYSPCTYICPAGLWWWINKRELYLINLCLINLRSVILSQPHLQQPNFAFLSNKCILCLSDPPCSRTSYGKDKAQRPNQYRQ